MRHDLQRLTEMRGPVHLGRIFAAGDRLRNLPRTLTQLGGRRSFGQSASETCSCWPTLYALASHPLSSSSMSSRLRGGNR